VHPDAVNRRRRAACIAGLVVLAAALASPLDAAAHRSFAAHMVQHLLLMLVAAPLLVWGRAGVLMLVALPPEWRATAAHAGRRLRALRGPVTAWVLFAVALWGWHLPGPYDAALRNTWIHLAEHVSFFGTSLLWWAWVFGRRRLEPARGIVYVFTTMVHGAWLAAILALSPHVIYGFYALARGPSALTDQQSAGVLMWVPVAFVYIGVIVALGFRLFADVEARVRRAEALAR
jgi:putative membrane protein